MSDPLVSQRPHLEARKSFLPKQPVELAEPKSDAITYEELAQCDGECTHILLSAHSRAEQAPQAHLQPGPATGRRGACSKTPSSSSTFSTQPLGTKDDKPTLVAIKGTVFDVSKNKAYAPGGSYHVFAGKDPSRALALSSLKPEECVPEWHDLEDSSKTVLEEWFSFFSKRYNIVGQVSHTSSDDAGAKL